MLAINNKGQCHSVHLVGNEIIVTKQNQYTYNYIQLPFCFDTFKHYKFQPSLQKKAKSGPEF